MYSLSLSDTETVYFHKKEDWEKYKKEEAKYCVNAYFDFARSMTLSERAKRRNVLYKKRKEFARKMGYGPTPGNRKKWVKNPVRDGNRVA